MKLSEFNDLCDREWANGRSDVVALRLTDESYKELAEDALIRGAAGAPVLLPLGEMLNPVTRSVVKVTGGASANLIEVARTFAGATEIRADQDFTISRGRLAGEIRFGA